MITLAKPSKFSLPKPSLFLHLTDLVHLPSNSKWFFIQILYEMGELLASTLNLYFSRDEITWNPTRKTKDDKEPWRALYG